MVGTVGSVDLLTDCMSTSHETTELSAFVGQEECEDETALLNRVSSVLDVTDCKRSLNAQLIEQLDFETRMWG